MLITDYQMPEIDGEELCVKVRKQLGLKDMPIILLSADGSRERKLEIFKAGATDYVEKPFLAEELRARVEAQLLQVDSLRRIRSLNTQLSTSNQSLNSFVAMASHDLRTPIGNSSTILEAMMEDWKETSDEEKIEFLEMAKDSSSRALSILEGLLKYSTSSCKSLEVKEIDPAQLFEHIASDLKFKIDEKQASVEWDELPSFQGDQALIHQVFINLIGNALKYQSKSNIPNVYVHLVEEDEDQFTCMVEDNGIGFTEEDGKKLFEPFTRVGNPTAYEGTGIGLSTVSNVIKRHGGRIWATSEPGVGSRFFIELPKRLEAE